MIIAIALLFAVILKVVDKSDKTDDSLRDSFESSATSTTLDPSVDIAQNNSVAISERDWLGLSGKKNKETETNPFALADEDEEVKARR